MRLYLCFLVGLFLFVVSCKPKCSTCPGMKPNKHQKEAKKMERKMDREAKKKSK